MMDLVQTGIYPCTFDQYRRIPAVNDSTLSEGVRSMQHMRHAMTHPRRETAAMRAGRLIHMSVLEPLDFDRAFVVMPDLSDGLFTQDGRPTKSKNSSEYKARLAEWQAEHEGMEVIEAEEHARCIAIRDAVMRHPVACKMASAPIREYAAVSWLMGVPVKCRPDAYSPCGVLWDLKTTDDASPDGFRRVVKQLRYHRKMAMYRDIVGAAGGRVDEVYIVAAEQDPPHGIKVYRVTDDQIAAGRAEYESILSEYVVAESTGRWAGYSEDIEDLPTPWGVGNDIGLPSEPMPDFEAAIGGSA